MEKLLLDVAAVQKLRDLRQSAELCDADGTVVGIFTPSGKDEGDEVEDPPSEQELSRIDGNFQGRTLADILERLQAG